MEDADDTAPVVEPPLPLTRNALCLLLPLICACPYELKDADVDVIMLDGSDRADVNVINNAIDRKSSTIVSFFGRNNGDWYRRCEVEGPCVIFILQVMPLVF